MKKVLLFLSLMFIFTFTSAQEVKLWKVTSFNTNIDNIETIQESTISLYTNKNLIVVYSDNQQILEYTNIIKNKNIDGTIVYNMFCKNRNTKNNDNCLVEIKLFKNYDGILTITYNDIIYRYNIVPLT